MISVDLHVYYYCWKLILRIILFGIGFEDLTFINESLNLFCGIISICTIVHIKKY